MFAVHPGLVRCGSTADEGGPGLAANGLEKLAPVAVKRAEPCWLFAVLLGSAWWLALSEVWLWSNPGGWGHPRLPHSSERSWAPPRTASLLDRRGRVDMLGWRRAIERCLDAVSLGDALGRSSVSSRRTWSGTRRTKSSAPAADTRLRREGTAGAAEGKHAAPVSLLLCARPRHACRAAAKRVKSTLCWRCICCSSSHL